MKKATRFLTSFVACAAACAMTMTAFAATPAETAKTRASESKSYLSDMNKKDGGLDEWGLIGLAASGVSGDNEAVKALITTALTDISENGFTGTAGSYGESAWGSNAGNLAKLILLLNSQGISPYTFGAHDGFAGYDLVATLFNTEHYYKTVSAYDVPYSLMVYDALGISAAEEATYKYSREDLVKKCLGLIGTVNALASAIPGGSDGMTGVANTFDTTGKSPYDFESTAMALQALAPYYKTGSKAGLIDASVKAEVDTKADGCIASIKQLQTASGGISYAFFTYDADWNSQFAKYADSADAMAQIALAFTALGEDIANVKHANGPSMLDNLLSGEYQTSVAGEFRANADPLTAGYSTYYTTKFAYLALASYNEMADNGGTAFSFFNRSTPVSYGSYDYSFFYPAADNGNDDTTTPSQPETKPEVKDPVKTGDVFPATGTALLFVLCGASIIWLKKSRASR